jgi:hypothetical protein
MTLPVYCIFTDIRHDILYDQAFNVFDTSCSCHEKQNYSINLVMVKCSLVLLPFVPPGVFPWWGSQKIRLALLHLRIFLQIAPLYIIDLSVDGTTNCEISFNINI